MTNEHPQGVDSQLEAQRRTGERIREELRGYEELKSRIAREEARKRAKRITQRGERAARRARDAR